MHIREQLLSWRSPVTETQAQLLAQLARELVAAYERQPDASLPEWFALHEYARFVMGAEACGFTCRDLSPDEDFDAMATWPRDHLATCGLAKLRRFTHTLLREERWADGYASPIRETVANGALQLVAERLTSDQALREGD